MFVTEECRHIRVNGTKCRAAALTRNAWCFFHDRIYKERDAHQPRRASGQAALPADTLDYGCVPVHAVQGPNDAPIELPLIEDLSSIQLAISRILHAIAANTIDPKRAGLLLYGLQIAAQNLPREEPKSWDTVAEVVHTAGGTAVALAEPGELAKESFASLARRLRLNLKALGEIDADENAKLELTAEKRVPAKPRSRSGTALN